MEYEAPHPRKITDAHLDRMAVVYVRQSTAQQVLNHRESTRLQYGLRDDARRMGWPEKRVLVIDDDLGCSGADSEGREGFRRLVSEVGLDHVRIILGVEMSRLARSSKDWHQLLEICALFGTLIADLDGVYDPAHYNDRLLLGLKGTMSEAELHLINQRMQRGKLSKARRGELVSGVPLGYLKKPSGEVVLDPDEEARHVVGVVFRKFEELGTLHGLLRYLADHGVRLPFRERTGVGKGEFSWRRPNRQTLHNMLQTLFSSRGVRVRSQASRSAEANAGRALHRPGVAPAEAVDGAHQGPHAGLHILGAIRAQPGSSSVQPLARTGDGIGAGREGAFVGAGGLRQVRGEDERMVQREGGALHLHVRQAEDDLRRADMPERPRSAAGWLRGHRGAQGS